MTSLAVILVLGAVPAGAAAKPGCGAGQSVPTDSEIDQYAQSIPGACGNQQNETGFGGSGGGVGGGGGSGDAGSSAITPSTVQRLYDLGANGAGTQALADANAPQIRGDGGDRGQGSKGGGGSDSAPPPPATMGADLALAQTVSTAAAGKDVVMSLTATNNGPAGATSVTVTIEGELHTLSGRTVDDAGFPIAGVRVKVHGTRTRSPVTAVGGPRDDTQQTISDAQGRYRFEPVVPGTYAVSAYYSVGGHAEIEIRRSAIIVAGAEAVVVPLWLETVR